VSAIAAHLRRRVAERAGNLCEYCRLPSRGQVGPFPVDHVTPRTAGGVTEFENLALACPACNGHKWAHTTGIDSISGEVASLFNPRVQIWIEHFRWDFNDPDILEGTTPTGRATIDRLQMNDPALVMVRRLLRELGIPVNKTH